MELGFFFVYLTALLKSLANKMVTKNRCGSQRSKAGGSFMVSEDIRNELLGWGTKIQLHHGEEAGECLQEDKLKEVVKKYSEFIISFSLGKNKVVVKVSVDED